MSKHFLAKLQKVLCLSNIVHAKNKTFTVASGTKCEGYSAMFIKELNISSLPVYVLLYHDMLFGEFGFGPIVLKINELFIEFCENIIMSCIIQNEIDVKKT